jgi:hypothetical protein
VSRVFVLLSLFGAISGCGYHVAGHDANLIPQSIQTIYVPAWENATTRFKLTDSIPQDIGREFISRTRFQVVTKPDNADAILTGTILRQYASPAILDPATSRASAVQVEVTLAARLVDKKTGKTIWENGWFSFKQRYEISTTPTAYVDESGPAVVRLSREVARSVVSAILSNF